MNKFTLILFLIFSTQYLFAQTLADSVIVKELNLFAKKNYSQNSHIAESKEKAEKALELSKKIKYYKGEINALLILEAILTLQNKAEEGEKKLNEAQKLAEKIKALPELATCYHTKAYNSYLKGNHAEALELHEKALKIRLQLKDESGVAAVYNSIGNIHNSKGNLEIAMEYYMKAMAIREKLNDQAGMSAIFNNLGNVAFNLSNYRQALDYYEKSYKIKVEQNDKKGMAASLVNVASAYKKLGDAQKSLSLQLKALAIQEETKDLKSMGANLNNLGTYYLQINQYDTALLYYYKSIKIREQTKEEQNKIIAQLGVANAYIKKNNLDSTWLYLNIAVNSAKKIGAKREERDANRLFSDFYYLKGEFKSAFDAYRTYVLIKDSLLSDERTKAINKMQAQYDNLQKEKENELLRKENALHQVELERKSLAEKQLILQAEQDKQSSLILLTENKIKETELKNSQLKNETQEKENLILTQQKEQQKNELHLHEEAIRFQQYFILLACAVLFFSIYFTIYIWKSRNKQRRVNEELSLKNAEILSKNAEINQQKEEIEATAENLKDAYLNISDKNKQIEEKNANLTASINYAKRIQTAILPDTNVINLYAKEFAIFWKPKDIVSGDFYWFGEVVENGKKQCIIAVLDCTGHGVPGAFMSMIGNDLLNAIIIEKQISEPAKILAELDHEVRRVLRQEATQSRDGMDIAVCKIDPEKQVICYSGAKIPFLAINHKGETIYIPATKKSIGGHLDTKNISFEEHCFDYRQGLNFYLYSDGFQDQFGGVFPFTKYKSKPFREMLISHSPQSMTAQQNLWATNFKEWSAEIQAQTDDVLVFGAKL